MSYIYLQEQGEVSSVDNFSDIPQSALSKLRSTQDKSCCNDNETECCLSSPSGTTYAPLTESPGEEQLMLFAEDSPAKTSVQREREPALEESVRDYGKSMPELLARYGLSLSLRKTPRYCGVAGLTLSSKTCPSWGMMRDGACWELGTSARPIRETGCGYLPKLAPTPRAQEPGYNVQGYVDCLNDVAKGRKGWNKMWPTPQASDNRDRGNLSTPSVQRRLKQGKQLMLSMVVSKKSGSLNPTWVEWLMGWPIDWTASKPLETDKFQQWQQQHGGF